MTNDLITLDLTGMAHGGSAIGRHEGRAIFVPYGIPGEQVQVRIVQDKGRFAIAELVEVVSPSPSRISPPCSHFGRGKCGGCQFQFIDYAKQLELKQQVVQEQLARLGGLPDVVVYPTIASPSPYGYRSHATFHVTPTGKLGFVKTDHRTVMPIDECHLIDPLLRDSLDAARDEYFTHGSRVRFQIGSEQQAIHFAMGNIMDDIAETLPDKPRTSQPQRPTDIPDGGDVHYQIKGRSFRCSSGSFFQVNLPQAEKLIDLILERLNLKGIEQVLDLYSGVGLFTAFLADHADQVSAVEIFAPAIEDARENLADYENISLFVGKIEQVLPKLIGQYDVAVIDPPRAGMDAPALDALIRMKTHQIVYVSCDPATLARDAKRLTAAGYTLENVQPVDMFPQTYHIECVAHFTR